MPDPDAEALRTHRALAAARERLAARDGAILRTQIEISEIAAPTGEESDRAVWIARRFAALGLVDIRTDDAGNVIGRRRGGNGGSGKNGRGSVAPVVVCAHLDTVFPRETPLRVRREGTLLSGPGIGDNGRGLAVMLALAEEIDGARLRTRRPIDFVATTGEEGLGDLRGAKHLFEASHGEATAMIALDGAGDERVIHRALGARRYRIAYRGPGGHSWAAYGVPNPVHAAGAAAARLAAIPLPATPRTTLTVGRIGGGISVNAIPEEGWLEVDLRSTSGRIIERADRELRVIAMQAAEEENARRAPGTPPLGTCVTVIGDRPCGETAREHPLVLAAVAATRLVGREPELATASTDANVPISRGIPAVAIGAGGRGGEAHTAGEWFDNTEGGLGIARALTLIVATAGLEGRA
jgi:acetylornithine deacetylase/succinyl-diaminopimelate desuccinylase-like protein